MADLKITGLTELAAAPESTDILAIVDDPGGSPATKKIEVGNLFTSPTLTTPQLNGIVTTTGLTMPAFTAGGVISGTKRSVFAHVDAVTGTGTLHNAHTIFPTTSLGDASNDGYARIMVPIPTDFVTLTKAVIICWSSETGDLRWAASTSWGADGEAYNANADSISTTTRGMTADQLDAIDVSAALTGIAAGDYFGFRFYRAGDQAEDTITTLFVLGLLLEYTT